MKLPLVSIIIPMYNSEKTIAECLEHVYASNYKKFEVIVADDGSMDNSIQIAEKFPCRIIQLKKNFGVATAYNTGAKNAKGDILYFVDSDVLIPKNALSIIVDSFKENPGIDGVVGLLSKKHINKNFPSQYKNLHMHYNYIELPRYISILFTSSAAIKRNIFEKNGDFDTNYKGARLEDLEFGQRLTTRGHKLYLNKKLQVEHLKKLSVYDFLRTDYARSYDLIKIMLRDKFKKIVRENYTPVSKKFILSIPLSYITLLMLVLSSRDLSYSVMTALFYLTILLLNIDFLIFTRKVNGLTFAMMSCGMIFIDFLVIGLGIFVGISSYISGKRY